MTRHVEGNSFNQDKATLQRQIDQNLMPTKDAEEAKLGIIDSQKALLRATYSRFPVSVVYALVLTLCALVFPSVIYGLEFGHGFSVPLFGEFSPDQKKFFLVALGGFLWLTLMALVAETQRWPMTKQLAVVLPVLGAFGLWSGLTGENTVPAGLMLVLACGLSLSYAPWLCQPSDNLAFLRFNSQLFFNLTVRFGKACLTSIFVPLALFIIFGMLVWILLSLAFRPSPPSIVEWLVSTPLIFLIFLYLPIHFLAAIPKQDDFQQPTKAIPENLRGLLLELQEFLLLLLVLKAVIACVFGDGGHPVAYVKDIFILLAVGIFAHATTYPLGHSTPFLKRFYWGFYGLSLIPLGFALNSLNYLIEKHGITENRYFAYLLGVWFVIVAVLFYVRNKDFKLQAAPQILALFCVLAVVGPWRIDDFPAESQFKRLVSKLESKGWLKNGQYTPPPPMKGADHKWQIKPITDIIIHLYHYDFNLIERARPWFADQEAFAREFPDMTVKRWGGYDRFNQHWHLIQHMGLEEMREPKPVVVPVQEPKPPLAPLPEIYFSVRLDRQAEIPMDYYKSFDYVILFESFELTNSIEQYFLAPADSKDKSAQWIHMKNTTPGQVEVDFGRIEPPSAQDKIKISTSLYVASNVSQEALMTKPRAISLDLNAFLAKLEQKYPKTFAHPSPSLFDEPQAKYINLPAAINPKVSMKFDIAGQNVHGQVIFSEIGFKVDPISLKKKIVGFNGIIYLKLTD